MGMRNPILVICGLLALNGLTACLPARTPLPPLPTDTPLPPADTPTPTTIWFPPTATFTPLPAVTTPLTPTLDLSPHFGALLFDDNFTADSPWTLGRTTIGSMALGVNELTLAVTQSRGYLYSARQGVVLGDFYLEITASPSLCRGADEYGLLLRVSPALEFLRFGLLCNGKARLDRIVGGQASSPVPPTLVGAVPPGAPSTSLLGVWALGKELRFYANGQFLFAARESVLLSGGLGVFARASGSDALTVNFSHLSIYAANP
jgi:hypothetical protein